MKDCFPPVPFRNSTVGLAVKALTVSVGLGLTPALQATVIDWSGTTDPTWATGTNWVGNVAPANDLTTDIASFNAASYANLPDAGTTSINGLSIGAGSTGALTISGTSLSIGSGGLTKAAGSGAVTISSGIVIGANQSWTNNSTVSSGITVSGALTGSANLNLNVSTSQKENGSFTLSGNNSGYSGNISISNGRVATSNANSFGTGTVTVNSGAQAFFGQPGTFANNLVVSGTGYAGGVAQNYALRMDAGTILSGTVTVAGSANLSSHNRAATISGQITSTGAGDVTFIGSNGIITLSNGANNWAGTTTLNNQNLTLGADNVLPNGTTVTFASNAILDLASRSETVDLLSSTGTNGIIQNSTAASTGTLTLGGGAAASASFGGVIRNNGGTGGTVALTKIGSGTQTLTGANTYTGATTINGGVLQLGASDRLSDSSNMVLGGGTFATGGFSETVGTLTINSTSVLDFGAGTSALVFADSSAISWTGTLTLQNFDIGTDTLRFGSSASALTGGQLGAISLSGYSASLNSSGFVTFAAVPEPSTMAMLLASLGGLLWVQRASRRRA